MRNTEGSMTTSSELVLVQPSPSRMRTRKSRHRRNNSHGSNKDVTSPAKSPTLGSSRHSKPQDLLSPPSPFRSDQLDQERGFKFMSPSTAIKEQDGIEEESEDMVLNQCQIDQITKGIAHIQESEINKNSSSSIPQKHSPGDEASLRDVCFGCDGTCSDGTCSSKRSSQISADVESTCDASPLHSPHTQALEAMSEVTSPECDSSSRMQDTGSCSCSCSPLTSPAESQKPKNSNYTVREKDSNENLHCTITNVIEPLSYTTQINSVNTQKDKTNGDSIPTSLNCVNTSITHCCSSPRLTTSSPINSCNQSGVKRVHSSQDMTGKKHRSPVRRRRSDIIDGQNYERRVFDADRRAIERYIVEDKRYKESCKRESPRNFSRKVSVFMH